MADELDAIQAIKKFSGVHQTRLKWWLAYAGDGQGNVYTSQANYYLVRYPLASSPTVEIFNNRINLIDGLRIIVGYTAYQPNLLQVLDVADQRLDGVSATDTPISPGTVGYSTVPPHWVNHQYLGADYGLVNWRQLSALGVFPTAPPSLSVVIWPGTIPRPGADINVGYTTVDLTSHVPGSGARYALISFNSSGSPVVTDGTINAGGFAALTNADVPDTPAGNWRSCAVALYVSQTAIVENTSEIDFLDLRFPEEISAGTITITPAQILLTHDHIIVGDSGGLGADVALSRDATIADTGALTVVGLQARDVASTAPADGEVLTWNAAANHWQPGAQAINLFSNLGIDGRLAVIPTAGSIVIPETLGIAAVYIHCDNLGSAGSTIIDVNKNGSTIFPIQADRPTLPYNESSTVGYAVPPSNSFAQFDRLTFDIDQVATGAESLTITVQYGAANVGLLPPPATNLDGFKLGSNTDNVVLQLGAGGAWDSVYITMPSIVVKDGVIYLFYSGFDGTNSRIGVATANVSGFTGVNFSKYGSNPILDLGSGGSWEDAHVTQPTVIYDAEAGLWKMWYVGNHSGVAKVGYATSSDPLGPWTKYGGNPILSPATWEGSIIAGMSVLKESSTSYKMLYHGNDVLGSSAIGLATSSDGLTWTKYASNPVLQKNVGQAWRSWSVFCPRTLIKLGGTYYLYFNGKESTGDLRSKIGYATSSDLITWTVQDTPLILTYTRTWEGAGTPPGEVEEPFGIQIGNKFYAYYFCWFGNPRTIGVSVVPLT